MLQGQENEFPSPCGKRQSDPNPHWIQCRPADLAVSAQVRIGLPEIYSIGNFCRCVKGDLWKRTAIVLPAINYEAGLIG